MSEKTDYKLLKKHLPKRSDRIDRIENLVVAGMPDINYCIDGIDGWIEMKSPKEPLRESSKLFADNHKLNQDQKNWFLRQYNAGGRAFILICTDVRWMLIDGSLADIINDMTGDELWKIANWSMSKAAFDIDSWLALRRCLS